MEYVSSVNILRLALDAFVTFGFGCQLKVGIIYGAVIMSGGFDDSWFRFFGFGLVLGFGSGVSCTGALNKKTHIQQNQSMTQISRIAKQGLIQYHKVFIKICLKQLCDLCANTQ